MKNAIVEEQKQRKGNSIYRGLGGLGRASGGYYCGAHSVWAECSKQPSNAVPFGGTAMRSSQTTRAI